MLDVTLSVGRVSLTGRVRQFRTGRRLPTMLIEAALDGGPIKNHWLAAFDLLEKARILLEERREEFANSILARERIVPT